MIQVVRGTSATLTVEFFQFAGGPLADVTGLTVAIASVGGTVVVPTTSVGITHPMVGTYQWVWAVPVDLAVGDYVVTWSATADGSPVTAQELVRVLTTPAGAWFTVADLAYFTGRAESSFTAFAATALEQAQLLFTLRTGMTELPTDVFERGLVKNAILEMADDIYLKSTYREVKAKPFSSETIGSYSYSLSAAAVRASSGEKTGLMWWDLAMERFAKEVSDLFSGGLMVFDLTSRVEYTVEDGHAHGVFTGPSQDLAWDLPFDINSDRAYRPRSS